MTCAFAGGRSLILLIRGSQQPSHVDPKPAFDHVTPSLLLPIAVAYDQAGDLFFADARRHQVFELTLAGTWSVIAGTGEQGFSGDGGTATAALLNTPRGIAVSADGTVYIADSGNQRIRAVANGLITTVAGTGTRGYTGDGLALHTALADPAALAIDAGGNLLVCDTGNQRVRRLSGGNISTIAGNGVQGYAGDGAAATAAELDTPLGLAVTASGAILVADTHNQRLRSITPDGTITTFAGTGTKGFSGDSGAATLAALDMPFGVAIGSDGSVLIADAGNQRIRSVSAQGVITTVAGSGVQGTAPDATADTTAALNNPRAVSLQLQGQPVFADSSNGLVRELADDNALYTLALLAAPRASSITIGPSTPAVYGQASASVSVTGSAATPQGAVMLLDSGVKVGSSQLSAGSASFSLGQLAAGSHVLSATYAGDGLNGSSTSPATPLLIAAAPAVATANAASAVYGGPLPSLTGTLAGILPQDAATVHAAFSSSATSLSAVGSYPIAATLTGQGSANYLLSMGANSGALVISQAQSSTTLASVAQTYAGLPVLLSATVASTTTGLPTGSVDFLDGATLVSSGSLVNGTARASLLSSAQGAHSFSARYSGNMNFLPSTSAAVSLTVAAMPDFTLALASSSASVQGGSVAVFTVSVAPQSGPFTGVVNLSVAGLPQGASANFSPASVVPGSSAVNVTLSVQTVVRTGIVRSRQRVRVGLVLGLFLALWWLPRSRQARRRLGAVSVLSLVLMLPLLGCGTRTAGSATTSGQTSTLTISGTGTNLAGATVSHTTVATLTVY